MTPSKTNDGSLHVASLCLEPEILSILLKMCHDVDYRCSRMEGFTTLATLACDCDPCGRSNELEDCIDHLKKAGANSRLLFGDHTILFLALRIPSVLWS
jgi:hypothetical protein